MKKILIIISCYLLCGQWLYAQDYEMFYKYWHYKERFYKQYVRIDWGGDGIGTYINLNEPSTSSNYSKRDLFSKAGYSIPVERVLPWVNVGTGADFCENQPASVRDIVGTVAPSTAAVIDYGGDSFIRIGNYLALLATEYKLLTINNQQVRAQKTLEEIYLALQAIRRLDMTANHWMDRQENCSAQNSSVNYSGYSGLMLREDAPYSFWQEYRNPTVSGNPVYDIVGAIKGHQIACGSSTIAADLHNFDIKKGYATLSQDQIIGVLFGLRFITKLLPNNTMFNGVNVKHIAGQIAYNMLNTVQWDGLRNMIIPLCPSHFLGNMYGGETLGFIYPMTLSCIKIAQESGFYTNPNLTILPNDPINFSFFYYVYMMGLSSQDMNYNFVLGVRTAATSDYGTMGDLMYLANKMGNNAPLFPMAAAVLRDQPVASLNSGYNYTMMDLLLKAPCNSPGAYPGHPVCDAGWRTSMKWDRPWVSTDYGIFNGLDYMLAYNLYHLLYHPNTPYYDIENPENNINFPNSQDEYSIYPVFFPGFGYVNHGSNVEPVKLFGNSISTNVSVKGVVTTFENNVVSGELLHKAKKSITLNVGFKAEAGSHYIALIEDPECVWNSNTFLRPVSSSTASTNTIEELERDLLTKSEEENNNTAINMAIEELNAMPDNALKVYPNPSTGRVHIKVEAQNLQDGRLAIYDMQGRLLRTLAEGNLNAEVYRYDFDQEPSGIYMVQLITNEGTYTQKVVITK